MKILSLVIFNLLLSLISTAQPMDWVKGFGGADSERSISSVIDALGNVYTTGYFKNTVDFDPGPNTADLISGAAHDVFIQKLDSSGNFLWAKSLGGMFSDALGVAIGVDDSMHIYVTGRFNGTVDLDPGVDVFNLASVGPTDIFIVKLDTIGQFLWAKQLGGRSVFINETVNSLEVDCKNNVLITGYFYGTVDFDPGPDTFDIVSGGGADVYILKLDSDGNFLWVKNLDGPRSSWSNDIATDRSANVLISGYFDDVIDFDPNQGIVSDTAIENIDAYVLKLDENGSFLWVNRISGSLYDMGRGVAVDSLNNVYAMGSFHDTIDIDPSTNVSQLFSNGGADVFIQKLDPAGNLIWGKSIGGIRSDIAHSIASDAIGNVYLSGYFSETVDFDPGPQVNNLISTGLNNFYDAFIQKLDQNGQFLWAKSMGGTKWDVATSITADNDGNVYTTGIFSDTVDLNPNLGQTFLASNGGFDIFIQKLNPCIAKKSTDVIMACDSITWIDGLVYTADNNTASYTILDGDNCDSTITLDLKIMSIELDSIKNIGCFSSNDGLIKIAVSGGIHPLSYSWNNGANTPEIKNLSSATYHLTVTDATGCIKGFEDTISPPIIPVVNPYIGNKFTQDTCIDYDEEIWLFAGLDQTNEGVKYVWEEISNLGNINFLNEFSPYTSINPRPDSEGVYSIKMTATSNEGCIDSGLVSVKVKVAQFFGMPNVFTPNNDGINDFFGPLDLDRKYIVSFKVYNRWGKLIFESNDGKSHWDGSHNNIKQSANVYFYVLNYHLPNQEESLIKGEFTLIR